MTESITFGDLPLGGKRFTHEGIDCYVVMGPFSINGYIKLPDGHPWLDYPDSLEDHPEIIVHGGITYQQGRVIGFDTAHLGDAWHPQSESARLTPEFHRGLGHVWEEPEVVEETKRLAEQAADAQHQEHHMTKYTRTRPLAYTPTRAHSTDAGVDLAAAAIKTKDGWDDHFTSVSIPRAGGTQAFGTGIAVAIPEGHVGMLFVRSSLGIKRNLVLANGTGIIDSGFRGEIIACLRNEGDTPATIVRGERIAQLVIVPCDLTEWQEVDSLDRTDRGEAGIGSTGK